MTGHRLDELMARLAPEQPPSATEPLTAISYLRVRINGAGSLELRIRSLGVGKPWPTLPLALGSLGDVMLDLEAACEEAREQSR